MNWKPYPAFRPLKAGEYLICLENGNWKKQTWNGSGWAYTDDHQVKLWAEVYTPEAINHRTMDEYALNQLKKLGLKFHEAQHFLHLMAKFQYCGDPVVNFTESQADNIAEEPSQYFEEFLVQAANSIFNRQGH